MSCDKQSIRRKHSSVDLQQVVTRVDVYKRPLQGGKSGVAFGIVHEAAVATTEKGTLYLIEKGVLHNEDINYPTRYREGECRIVEITPNIIRDWKLVRSVKDVDPGITLEDLFDSCGSEYSVLNDNCWNSTQRMRARAKESEAGLTWQKKGVIGAVGVGVGVGIAVGFGFALAAAFAGDKKKEKEKEAQKY